MTLKLIIVVFLLSGCVGILTSRQAQELTPEQIKAFTDAQEDIYVCISVIGPPPNGSVQILVIPKNKTATIALAPNCQMSSGKIEINSQ